MDAALPLIVAAATALASPHDEEAFFGYVKADAPAGARSASLYVDGQRAATATVDGRRVVFPVPAATGRHDVSVRFVPAGRSVARRVWLLPPRSQVAVRERSRDARLARRLAGLGRSYPGWAALWVHDLRTGRTAGWNSDTSFPAASVVKLGVLIAALDRYGPRPERSAAWKDIKDLAVWSSNLATNKLLVRLGGSESGGSRIAERVLHRIGARSSTFTGFYRLGTAAASDSPKPLPVLTYRRTTAHDVGRILFELHAAALGNRLALRRTGLSKHEARVGLALLLSSDPRDGNLGLFRPAVGESLPMAQKHGWTTKVLHSGAIVYRPNGATIIVALTFRPDRISARASRALGADLVNLATSR